MQTEQKYWSRQSVVFLEGWKRVERWGKFYAYFWEFQNDIFFKSLDCKLWFNEELPRFDYNLHDSNDTAVANWRKEGYHWIV